MAVSLCVYGTLMDKLLVHQLTDKDFLTSFDILKDFKKLASYLGYPYIVPQNGSKAAGLLIKDVDPQSMQKLDEYEDEGIISMNPFYNEQ